MNKFMYMMPFLHIYFARRSGVPKKAFLAISCIFEAWSAPFSNHVWCWRICGQTTWKVGRMERWWWWHCRWWCSQWIWIRSESVWSCIEWIAVQTVQTSPGLEWGHWWQSEAPFWILLQEMNGYDVGTSSNDDIECFWPCRPCVGRAWESRVQTIKKAFLVKSQLNEGVRRSPKNLFYNVNRSTRRAGVEGIIYIILFCRAPVQSWMRWCSRMSCCVLLYIKNVNCVSL